MPLSEVADTLVNVASTPDMLPFIVPNEAIEPVMFASVRLLSLA